MADLITNYRAKQNIPSATSSDDPLIDFLISSVSKAVQRYTKRDFTRTSYDELYSGKGDNHTLLELRQYPILSVESVRYELATVLKAQNTSTTTNQQARVSVTSNGIKLLRVASGTSTTNQLLFSSYATMTLMAAAITAVGNGWSGQVESSTYNNWPSADLRNWQGSYFALNQWAELKLHVSELASYQVDERRGWLLRANPLADTSWDNRDKWTWPRGYNNYRVQYTAGYDNIPDDVQEACAEWVSALFWQAKRDPGVSQESVPQAFSRSYIAAVNSIPPSVRTLLNLYRHHTIGGELC